MLILSFFGIQNSRLFLNCPHFFLIDYVIATKGWVSLILFSLISINEILE
jgi:hypothetical protein